MVNKRETLYSDERLSSFFISLILSLFFYLYLLFPYLFRFNFVISELAERAHSFLTTYLGGTFSPLLDISERNLFSRWGGGAPPPAYAPGTCTDLTRIAQQHKAIF